MLVLLHAMLRAMPRGLDHCLANGTLGAMAEAVTLQDRSIMLYYDMLCYVSFADFEKLLEAFELFLS